MGNNTCFLVRVSCMTYNHVRYITDAMDGFVMQQTTFPFVCTIVDDASTDGEQETIRKYLQEHFDLQDSSVAYDRDTDYGHVTFAQHKTNNKCYFAVIYLKENHFSQKRSKTPYLTDWKDTKYVALCEGDDYWIDSLKLQKQVDFLERHPDYSMCFHSAEIKNEQGEDFDWIYCEDINNRDYSATELFEKWIVPTASMLYRDEITQYPIKKKERILNGDIFIVERCAHLGKVRGMEEKMSVYRIHQGGVTYDPEKQKERIQRYPQHYLEIKKDFPQIKKKIVNRNIGGSLFIKGSVAENPIIKYMYYFVGSFYSPNWLWKKVVRFVGKRI